jgi:SET domain-containing protein
LGHDIFMMDVLVRKSAIHGKGVFAARDFQKGEVILVWHPKLTTPAVAKRSPFAEWIDNKPYLLQTPERFVNHSCAPNSVVHERSDVALRAIKKGEEITSDYRKTMPGGKTFPCHCQHPQCGKLVRAP